MRLDDLNWFDVEEYLGHDNRLMIVLGSCEQHGYLSLLTDTKIPLALADAASEATGVLIAPPLNFGCSSYFLGYPGTFSLRIQTLLDLTEDLVRSAYSYGFRRLLFLNGHGGNDPARGRLHEIANDLGDLKLAWYSWWQSHSVEQVVLEHQLKPSHANWIEAFPFTRVSEIPTGEKIPPNIPGLLGADEIRSLYGDGVFGGFYQAKEEIYHQLFEVCHKDILRLLLFE